VATVARTLSLLDPNTSRKEAVQLCWGGRRDLSSTRESGARVLRSRHYEQRHLPNAPVRTRLCNAAGLEGISVRSGFESLRDHARRTRTITRFSRPRHVPPAFPCVPHSASATTYSRSSASASASCATHGSVSLWSLPCILSRCWSVTRVCARSLQCSRPGQR
jgi:hypothetical protein